MCLCFHFTIDLVCFALDYVICTYIRYIWVCVYLYPLVCIAIDFSLTAFYVQTSIVHQHTIMCIEFADKKSISKLYLIHCRLCAMFSGSIQVHLYDVYLICVGTFFFSFQIYLYQSMQLEKYINVSINFLFCIPIDMSSGKERETACNIKSCVCLSISI